MLSTGERASSEKRSGELLVSKRTKYLQPKLRGNTIYTSYTVMIHVYTLHVYIPVDHALFIQYTYIIISTLYKYKPYSVQHTMPYTIYMYLIIQPLIIHDTLTLCYRKCMNSFICVLLHVQVRCMFNDYM